MATSASGGVGCRHPSRIQFDADEKRQKRAISSDESCADERQRKRKRSVSGDRHEKKCVSVSREQQSAIIEAMHKAKASCEYAPWRLAGTQLGDFPWHVLKDPETTKSKLAHLGPGEFYDADVCPGEF